MPFILHLCNLHISFNRKARSKNIFIPLKQVLCLWIIFNQFQDLKKEVASFKYCIPFIPSRLFISCVFVRIFCAHNHFRTMRWLVSVKGTIIDVTVSSEIPHFPVPNCDICLMMKLSDTASRYNNVGDTDTK